MKCGKWYQSSRTGKREKTLTEGRRCEMICIPAMSFLPTDTNGGVHMTAKTLLPSWFCYEKGEVTFQYEFAVLPRGKVLSFKALKKAKRKW